MRNAPAVKAHEVRGTYSLTMSQTIAVHANAVPAMTPRQRLIPRTPWPEQGQQRQPQRASHQQPLPELCPQRHHRQRLKRHRDAAGVGNDRTPTVIHAMPTISASTALM